METFQDPATSVQTDPGQLPNNGEQPGDVNGGGGVQGQQDPNDLGPQNLSPELEDQRKQLLRDYHSKTQKLADERLRFEREMENLNSQSQTFQQLLQQDWFKQAAEAERARRNGTQQLNLTDEQFELLKSDKNAFQNYVANMASQIAQGRVEQTSQSVHETQGQVEELAVDREFDDVASRYKDFADLNESGALDEYLEAGFDYETAYQKAKWAQGGDIDALADKKAREILANSRDGAVAQRGTPQINGQRIIKAKNFDEAFDQVWDALQKGDKNVQVQRIK